MSEGRSIGSQESRTAKPGTRASCIQDGSQEDKDCGDLLQRTIAHRPDNEDRFRGIAPLEKRTCPHCGKSGGVPANAAWFQCPNCRRLVILTEAGQEEVRARVRAAVQKVQEKYSAPGKTLFSGPIALDGGED